MSSRFMIGCAFGLGGLLVILAGCGGGKPSRIHPSAIASDAGPKAIEMYDTNKDGKISGDELAKCPSLANKTVLARYDASGQGAVTAEAITARIKAWKESKLGRMPIVCTVQRNGKPLADAEVTLVPEKFLGDALQPAKGKSDSNGTASLTACEADGKPINPPGVSPGLYRVVITKAGANIPAKYSSEADTTLGLEVALDAREVSEGLTFDLKY